MSSVSGSLNYQYGTLSENLIPVWLHVWAILFLRAVWSLVRHVRCVMDMTKRLIYGVNHGTAQEKKGKECFDKVQEWIPL